MDVYDPKRNKERCPRCEGQRVRTLIWGVEGPTKRMAAAAGALVLGGKYSGPLRVHDAVCLQCAWSWKRGAGGGAFLYGMEGLLPHWHPSARPSKN